VHWYGDANESGFTDCFLIEWLDSNIEAQRLIGCLLKEPQRLGDSEGLVAEFVA